MAQDVFVNSQKILLEEFQKKKQELHLEEYHKQFLKTKATERVFRRSLEEITGDHLDISSGILPEVSSAIPPEGPLEKSHVEF